MRFPVFFFGWYAEDGYVLISARYVCCLFGGGASSVHETLSQDKQLSGQTYCQFDWVGGMIPIEVEAALWMAFTTKVIRFCKGFEVDTVDLFCPHKQNTQLSLM